jgi:hypothetical protein
MASVFQYQHEMTAPMTSPPMESDPKRIDWRDSGPVEMRFAESPVDRDAVYRFRHRILGPEQGTLRGFTASNGRLLEAADDESELLAAFTSAGEVQAVVRLETVASAFQRLGVPFDRDHLVGSEIEPGIRASFSSRLLVDPAVSGHVAIRLLVSMVGTISDRGFHHDLCLAPTGTVGLRNRLGYRAFGVRCANGAPGDDGPTELLHLKVPTPDGAKGRKGSNETTSRPWHRISRLGRGRTG